jgi:hypothetical protein
MHHSRMGVMKEMALVAADHRAAQLTRMEREQRYNTEARNLWMGGGAAALFAPP